MRAGAFGAVTIGYLILVLLLGGASAGGYGANALLQLAGAGLAGWAIWRGRDGAVDPRSLRLFMAALAVLAVVQFVPLPPFLWRHLPGRGQIADGFEMLGANPPWLTLSLSPWHSLASLSWWIPALALYLAMRAVGAPSVRRVTLAVAAVAALSVLLGLLQYFDGAGYIYAITNYGRAPGFFANSNHQSSFLLVTLALCVGDLLVWHGQRSRRNGWKPRAVAETALIPLLLIGIVLNGSLAVGIMLVPVGVALASVARPDWRLSSRLLAPALLVFALVLILLLMFGVLANDLTAAGAVPGISRHAFLATGLKVLGNFAPLGSGLGTFQELYRWYENPALVGTIFVNHAHDDLLELLIETGIFGAAAIAAFLGWFVPRAWRLWRVRASDAAVLAATIVVAVELVHSLADYPLRTAAMSSLVAIACAIIQRHRPAEPSLEGEQARQIARP